MKFKLPSVFALITLIPAALFAGEKATAQNCGCACCQGKETCCCQAAKASDAKRYPLKGVILEVRPGQPAVLVKHEEIVGFMPAMTMLLKVSVSDLQGAQKGQSITGTLVQREDGFWLEAIKRVGP